MASTLTASRPAPRALQAARPPAGSGRRSAAGHVLPLMLVSLLLCVSTLVGQVAWWLLLVFVGCAVWRLVLERRGAELPGIVLRLLIFLPSTIGVAMTYGVQPSAGSLMAFLIVLLSLKVLEMRTARDFVVVAVLGYFMVLSALFYNQGFALCLYLSAAVVLNTVVLIRVHLGARPGTLWPSVRLACGLLAQAAPLVVLLFIIFPRVHVNFLHLLGNGGYGTTGMSDHLQPGSVESLVQSTARAFRARIGASETLPLSQLYWRGLVLSRCEDPMSWSEGLLPGSGGAIQPGANSAPPAGSIEQHITVFPQGERWLYALDRPVQVTPSSVRPQLLAGSQQIRAEARLRSNAIYVVYSQLAPRSPPPVPLSPGLRKYFTQTAGSVSPRATSLVESWRANGATPVQIIAAARAFFRDGGFVYSLQPGSLPSGNALDYFLFQSKSGFCEHYAAAFGTLMRLAKIPARLVVGYQGGEVNPLDGYYTVRQCDAHAWCEVWLDDRGWLREDPTGLVAPDRVSFGAQGYAALTADGPLTPELRLARLGRLSSIGWVRWVQHNTSMAWESVDQQWNLMVLGYDPDKQAELMEGWGLSNVSWLVGVAMSMGGVFSVLLAGAVAMRLLQGLPGWRRRRPDEAARTWYARFCQRVRRATGVRRAPAEGPLDFAARAAARRPDLAGEIRRITDLYVALRYVPADAAAERTGLAAFLGAIKRFRPAAGPPAREPG